MQKKLIELIQLTRDLKYDLMDNASEQFKRVEKIEGRLQSLMAKVDIQEREGAAVPVGEELCPTDGGVAQGDPREAGA